MGATRIAKIDRILGRVVSLTPLPPSLVSIRRDDSGALVYTFNAPGQNPREIPEDDILHIRGFTLDGILGLSPISQAAQSLGIALAAEEAAGALFANGMRSSGYVAAPTVLNKGCATKRRRSSPDSAARRTRARFQS
jgi:phage portal protein BeeE